MKTHNPLVSVIIPAYNVEEYISKCVCSVLEQTYKRIEVIVVDDGSNDNTGDIVERLSAGNDNVLVAHQENRGVSAARNVGLKVSSGDYVAFVDADDWLEVDAIESLLSVVQCESTCVAVGKAWKVLGEGKKENQGSGYEGLENRLAELGPVECELPTYLFRYLLPARVAKSERFNEDIAIAEDAEYLYRVLLKCEKYKICDKFIYNYNCMRLSSAVADLLPWKCGQIRDVKRDILENELSLGRGKKAAEDYALAAFGYLRRVAWTSEYSRALNEERISHDVLKHCKGVKQRLYWAALSAPIIMRPIFMCLGINYRRSNHRRKSMRKR